MKFKIAWCLVLGFLVFSTSSCKTKEGCENTEMYQVPVDKDGNMSTKRGKSGLWSKKQGKKKRK